MIQAREAANACRKAKEEKEKLTKEGSKISMA